MPPHGDGPVSGVEIFPLPAHGDRPRLVADRLHLPRPGHLGLGGGQDLLPLAQAGEVGGGEGVVEGGGGRTGTMVLAAHEAYSSAWSGVDGVRCSVGPAGFWWRGRSS